MSTLAKPSPPAAAEPLSVAEPHVHGSLRQLALGALGVVYGDIGTSPLYALRECFIGPHAVAITHGNILGVLSLIFWSLVMVISVKYLTFVMRADNQGEGGILALLALSKAGAADRTAPSSRYGLLLLGLFGAALLYADGMITPAISVLSAVEGLGIATSAFEPFILPITVIILVALFAVQHRGTAGIAAIFGPVMLAWFAVLGILGLVRIVVQHGDHISVLTSVNPLYALAFFRENGWAGFLVLGSVVLVITGGEALYADMGHFGRRPIRVAWYAVVMPGLMLNYLGQGVLLLENGQQVRNPFYELAPAWGLYPLVALSTGATIIASQALISGAFSLTQQAVQLGFVPRFTVVHTSQAAHGQIYIPQINHILMVLCVLLVLGFQSSSALAGAYGMAVTGTMAITTLLFYAVARERWTWTRVATVAIVAAFLLFDAAYLGANTLKLFDGGWFPLVVGAVIFTVMTTWKRGRAELGRLLRLGSLPMDLFLADLATQQPPRVPGTAVFMTSDTGGVPNVLLHHFKHNKVLHQRVILLSIVTERRPEVPASERVDIVPLEHGFYRVIARFGFMEKPSVDVVLRCAASQGLVIEVPSTTFFLGRETLLATGRSGMMTWRKKLFAFLARNAPSAVQYFGIPPNRVIELGAQFEL
ncbi:MAG: potassium transporter Kup [Thermodesulfobacteriota bacterium]